MKKLFTAAVVMLAIATSSFAKDSKSNISIKALENFKSSYTHASNVEWSTTRDYSKACFLLEGEKVEAYYDFAGEMIGTSKAITMQNLPGVAQKKIAKKYGSYQVREAIEFDQSDEKNYFISLSNENEKVVLQVSQYGSISVFKRTRK